MAQDTLYVHKSGDAEVARVAQALNTLTYSTSITPDCALGGNMVLTVTDGVAFAINAPLNPLVGQQLTLLIRNTSGGAVGAITWNAVFKKTAFTTPATANNRAISFLYNGTNWVELFKTPADVPN